MNQCGDELGELCAGFFGVVLGDGVGAVAVAGGAAGGFVVGVGEDAIGEGLGVLLGDEGVVVIGSEDLADAGVVGGDDGQAEGHAFGDGVGVAFGG